VAVPVTNNAVAVPETKVAVAVPVTNVEEAVVSDFPILIEQLEVLSDADIFTSVT
jgi:hypothetical protein